MTTLDLQVSSGGDDGHWWVALNSSGNEVDLGYFNSAPMYAYFRFTGVTIPKGSTISAATLQLYAINWGSVPANAKVRIFAWAIDDAPVCDATHLPQDMTTTSAYEDWTPTWNYLEFNSLTDISSVIEEIVNRTGWSSGNAINIFVFPNSATDYIVSDSYDHVPANAAKLHITYTPASGGAKAAPKIPLLGVGLVALEKWLRDRKNLLKRLTT